MKYNKFIEIMHIAPIIPNNINIKIAVANVKLNETRAYGNK